MQALAPQQVAALATEMLVAMGTAQFAALSSTQTAALTPMQVMAIETADLRALATAALVGLGTLGIAALTTHQFQALGSAQIVALTTDQAHALTTDQISALTTAQTMALEPVDIRHMSSDQIAAFPTATIGLLTPAQLDAFVLATPIMLDLQGHGLHTLAATEGVPFDLLGTGHAARWGWAGEGSALLARDRNHDGLINDGTELYGVATLLPDGRRAGNGFAALAQEDSNHDGRITAADANFKDLRLWVDANHDGKTDPGELHALADFGIIELDLTAVTSARTDHGNLLRLVSSYKTDAGDTREMADVWLAADRAAPAAAGRGAPALDELLAPVPCALLNETGAAPADTSPPARAEPVHLGGHAAAWVREHSLYDNEARAGPLL